MLHLVHEGWPRIVTTVTTFVPTLEAHISAMEAGSVPSTHVTVFIKILDTGGVRSHT